MASSDTAPTRDSAYGLANAAVDRGHEVVIFFNAEGVRLLAASRKYGPLGGLVPRKVRLLACRTSAEECGIESKNQLAEGAEMSSLSELVEILERSEKVVFIG